MTRIENQVDLILENATIQGKPDTISTHIQLASDLVPAPRLAIPRSSSQTWTRRSASLPATFKLARGDLRLGTLSDILLNVLLARFDVVLSYDLETAFGWRGAERSCKLRLAVNESSDLDFVPVYFTSFESPGEPQTRTRNRIEPR